MAKDGLRFNHWHLCCSTLIMQIAAAAAWLQLHCQPKVDLSDFQLASVHQALLQVQGHPHCLQVQSVLGGHACTNLLNS